MIMKCPFCQHEGEPVVKKQLSVGGWILFAVLVLCCFVLCWIPFVIDGCKEEVRKCGKCGAKFP